MRGGSGKGGVIELGYDFVKISRFRSALHTIKLSQNSSD